MQQIFKTQYHSLMKGHLKDSEKFDEEKGEDGHESDDGNVNVGEDGASRHLQWIFEMILAIISRHKNWFAAGLLLTLFAFVALASWPQGRLNLKGLEDCTPNSAMAKAEQEMKVMEQMAKEVARRLDSGEEVANAAVELNKRKDEAMAEVTSSMITSEEKLHQHHAMQQVNGPRRLSMRKGNEYLTNDNVASYFAGRNVYLDKGHKYEIFRSRSSSQMVVTGGYLLGPPTFVIQNLKKRYTWLNTITSGGPETEDGVVENARYAYLELVKSIISGVAYQDAERTIIPKAGNFKLPARELDMNKRKRGSDWAYLGDTMTGWKRLDNVRNLIRDVIGNQVTGDYIETGVWRGGSSIFARAVLHAYGEADKRNSYVCDSFRGLPPGDAAANGLKHRQDKGWDEMPYLEVSDEIVVEDFQKFSLLDDNVIFVKGFFADSMGPLAKLMGPEGKLAVIRLDGDMYQSTVDVLYNIYDKLSVGGYVIVDDWTGFPAKNACEDFFAVHDFQPKIIRIDDLAAYWKKVEDVEVQKWRYQQGDFKAA